MEKRFFLAVLLSFLVLYFWGALTPRPNLESPETLQHSQQPDSKEVMSASDQARDEIAPTSSALPSSSDFKEQIKTLQSEHLSLDVSSRGGTLKGATIKEYQYKLPIANMTDVTNFSEQEFVLKSIDQTKARYVYENELYQVLRTHEILESGYLIKTTTKIVNKLGTSQKLNVKVTGIRLEMSNLESNGDDFTGSHARDKSLFEYVVKHANDTVRKNNAYKFTNKDNKEEMVAVDWVAFRDRYFCAIVKPEFETRGFTINEITEQRLDLNIAAKEMTIPPSGELSFSTVTFVGPEKLDLLESFNLGFEDIRRYYRFGLFDAISKIIDGIMHLLYKVMPNWGACIVVMSVLIYFSMYPLTLKSMQSMRKMQAMQPQMAKIREKYQNNPQKMNQEIMEFYKKERINPLGGCLPILLQMPVFIGLYQVLWRSVSFKGADFLWIKDLSEPDRLFLFPFNIPFVGNEFNLLPVIMMVVMAVQTKFQAKNMVVADPAQQQQQKMMNRIMPIFLGVIFYKFASGLTLYFTMFYIFSAFTQWKMSKNNKGA